MSFLTANGKVGRAVKQLKVLAEQLQSCFPPWKASDCKTGGLPPSQSADELFTIPLPHWTFKVHSQNEAAGAGVTTVRDSGFRGAPSVDFRTVFIPEERVRRKGGEVGGQPTTQALGPHPFPSIPSQASEAHHSFISVLAASPCPVRLVI